VNKTATESSARALSIIDLAKSYGEVQAVKSIDLTVESGELVGLIGPDGAGKTTLMRSVCGLIHPDKGKIKVFGFDPEKNPRQVRERIGYMPQRFSLYPDLTVAENIRFFADLYLVPADELSKREARLMEFSRLGPFRNRRAGHLSGGMKQKLALSCTLIHTPQLLILDEPTTGVDPVSRREFWTILKDLASEGIGLLVSTPYMDEAVLCHRVVLMHRGKALAEGTPSEITFRFPHKLCEVTSNDPTTLLHVLENVDLRGIPIIRFGGALHVIATDEEERSRVLAAARKAGFQAIPIEPTMEDAFVELLESAGGVQ